MNDQDRVRLCIYSKTSSAAVVITSRERAMQFREDVITNTIISGWYEVEGQIDHSNSNCISLVINYEDIAGFDITELNQL